MLYTDRMILFIKDHPRFCFCLVLLFGVFLRGLYYVYGYRISRDGLFYLDTARHWAEFDSCREALKDFTETTPPLFIWLLSRAIRWGCDPEIFANILNCATNVCLIVSAWFIGRCFFNSYIGAFVSALFFAIHPSVIEYAFDPIRESLSLFFVSLSFLFIIRMWKGGRWLDWILGGLFVACATSFRYEPYEFLLLLPLSWLLIEKSSRDKKKKEWILFVIFFLAFFLIYIPVHMYFGLLGSRIDVIKTYFTNAFLS